MAQNKLGFVAHEAGSEVVFSFTNTTNRIRFLKIHSLQSYGEEWKDSEAEFVLRDIKRERSLVVPGHHGMNNSLTIPHELDLGEMDSIPIGSNVTLTIRLVSGRNFKITAMFLCAR